MAAARRATFLELTPAVWGFWSLWLRGGRREHGRETVSGAPRRAAAAGGAREGGGACLPSRSGRCGSCRSSAWRPACRPSLPARGRGRGWGRWGVSRSAPQLAQRCSLLACGRSHCAGPRCRAASRARRPQPCSMRKPTESHQESFRSRQTCRSGGLDGARGRAGWGRVTSQGVREGSPRQGRPRAPTARGGASAGRPSPAKTSVWDGPRGFPPPVPAWPGPAQPGPNGWASGAACSGRPFGSPGARLVGDVVPAVPRAQLLQV
jgi:hypothetical protein